MRSQWAIEKRQELLRVILYSVVGLAVVIGLVTLANYALYANPAGK
jgi:hypothetical protein